MFILNVTRFKCIITYREYINHMKTVDSCDNVHTNTQQLLPVKKKHS